MNPSTVATRQETLLSELKLLEARFGRLSQTVKKWQQTPDASKLKEDEKRPAKKDGKAKQQSIPAPSSSTSSSSSDEVTLPSDDDPSRWWDESTYVVDNAGVVPRLRALCQSYGLTKSRFYRVSGNYYDWTLEQRRDALDPATTIQHLCKSVVMVNTRFQPPETEGNQKYILVIVSYAEKLHKERLANAVYDRYKRLTPEPKSKRAFDANWRLADNDEAIEMTGYQVKINKTLTSVLCLILMHVLTSLPLISLSSFSSAQRYDSNWNES